MKKQNVRPQVVLLVLFLASLLFVANGICQDEIQTIKLTRDVAIAMAIRNNIDLRVQALDSSMAQTDISASKAIYNPYLSASVDYSKSNVAGQDYGTATTSSSAGIAQTLPTGGNLSFLARTSPTSPVSDPLYDYTDWSSSIGITFIQPLLKNAGKDATELGISQDQYAYAASLETFRNDIIQTVFSVISEYNRLYVLNQLLESRQAALSSAQQLLEEIKTKPNPGDNSAIELSNTEYALSRRQTEQIEALRQVSSKGASLSYLIGIKERFHIVPIDPPSRDEPAESEKQAIALALEQSPDLKRLRIQLESNELREKVSKRNLWPDLSLTASGGYRGYAQDGGFGDTVTQIGDGKGEYWSAGMRVSYPFGNDSAKSAYRRNAIRSEQIRDQVFSAEWRVQDVIREDNRSLLSARLQMRATNKSKVLAEQRFAQYQKNRRLGTSSVKDLLDAENDLIYARNLELNAIENFAYLVASFWKDIGVLLERQNIHIDTSKPEMVAAGASLNASSQELLTAAGHLPASTSDAGSATPANLLAKPMEPPPTTDLAPANKSFTLKIGEYLASEVAAVKNKIARAGLVPEVMDGPKQEREVFRLFLGDYPDLSSAQKALKPLMGTSSQGFILKNDPSSYTAFAGSFFSEEPAMTDKELLAARGIKLSVRKVTVLLPTLLVTAGSYSSLEAAKAGVDKLAKQGLTAKILQYAE